MSVRLAVALWLAALVVDIAVQPAAAQADAHARALARASCQAGKQAETVVSATAALAREPDEFAPRMRLADALVDQGCYQEAVAVLEAGQQTRPRNNELAAKLRDVRSLVTEQTYIEGLTQAAEGAKFQRNQLRCTQLADVTACDDALKSKPDDAQLLAAKHDALAKRAALVASETPQGPTRAAGASQPMPAQSTTGKPAAARSAAAQSGTSPSDTAPSAATRSAMSASAPRPKRQPASASPSPDTTPAAPSAAQPASATTLASLTPTETKTYSNDAPPGHSN